MCWSTRFSSRKHASPFWLAVGLVHYIDFTMISITPLDAWVDFDKPSLYYSFGMIFFNPLFWNIVAQNGMYTHFVGPISSL